MQPHRILEALDRGLWIVLTFVVGTAGYLLGTWHGEAEMLAAFETFGCFLER